MKTSLNLLHKTIGVITMLIFALTGIIHLLVETRAA